jgi:lipoprotein-releasing system permease protein
VKAAIYIAWRYLFSKSQQSVVNLIAYITLSVIVVATAALLIVLSAFSGLKEYSLSYVEQNSPEYAVVGGKNGVFEIAAQQVGQLKAAGIDLVPVLKKQAVLQWDEGAAIGWFEGYPLGAGTSDAVLYGVSEPSKDSLLINLTLYRQSGLHPNDSRTLSVSVPKRSDRALSVGVGSSPLNTTSGRVSGVFQSAASDETPVVVLDYSRALSLLGLNQGWWVTQINLSSPLLDESDLRALVDRVFGEAVVLRSRAESNSALFKLLNSEHVATYIIFTLILILALFNLAGALNVILLDKQEQLPVFKQIGMTTAAMRTVFFLLGWFQVAFGTLVGVLLGAAIVWMQALFGWVKVAPDLAYPVSLELSQISLVAATLLLLGAVSSSVALLVAAPLKRR